MLPKTIMALGICLESVSRVSYTILSLLEEFYNAPFRSFPYLL